MEPEEKKPETEAEQDYSKYSSVYVIYGDNGEIIEPDVPF